MTKLNYCISANKRCNSGKDVEGQHVSTKVNQNHLIVRNMMSLLLMIVMLVGGNGFAWGQTLMPTTRYDNLSAVGNNQFALVNLSNRMVLYGKDAQNAAYGSYADAFVDTNTGYTFVLEKPTDGTYDADDYMLKFRTPTNSDYNIWGDGVAYLNANNSIVFVLGNGGSKGHNKGQDFDNGAVWTITEKSGNTFVLRNKGNGKYLNGMSVVENEADATKWSFCSVGAGCEVSFSANNSSMGYVTAKRLDTNAEISSGTYVPYGTNVELTAHPNSGYAFKNWSNSDTNLTRTWLVTQDGNPTANFEVGYTVTFSVVDKDNNAATDRGTVTAKVNGKEITSGTSVVSGTKVTFSVTANDSKYLSWGWYENGKRDYSPATVERTVTANLTMNPVLNQGVTFNVYPNDGTLGEVRVWLNETEKGTTFTANPGTKTITFRATPKADARFVGWYPNSSYNDTERVSVETTYTVPNTNNGLNLWGKFESTVVTHPANIDCLNNTIDLSKITAGSGASYDANTHQGTITNNYAGISVKFASAIDLHELNTLILAGTNAEKTSSSGAFNGVSFIYDGGNVTTYNYPFTISDDDREKLKKVTAINLFGDDKTHKGDFTLSSITLNFGGSHAPKATPTLTNGTTSEMVIFEGESLTITNTPGYWREFTDNNYNVEVNTRISEVKGNLYERTHTFDNLPIGEYYFAAQDATWCSWGHKHGSELVKIHVSVKAPINSIDVNGTTRQYDVYAPADISGTVGIVISLHGASNDYWNGRVDFNGIADNEKNTDKRFVVVYPRGLMRQLRGTERGWETYTESNTEDVEFFKAIVEKLKETYTVDMNRIYLAGFSNGGMMAYKAAHQAGDFFAAFASVGGFPVNESHLFHAGVQPTPFMHIQGKADNIFPSKTYPLDVIVHNLMYRNGASFTPAGNGNGAIAQNSNVEEDCHQAVEGGAAYYMYKVANMGHTWTWDWTGDGQDDVAPAMWAFFNKEGIAKNVDKTLKFRINSSNTFWDVASTGKTGGVNVGYIGFDNVNSGKSVLSYGGYSKIDNGDTYNKDTNNKNLWHSLQFQGGTNGAAHFLKLNVETDDVGGADHEVATDYFLVKLTKTGSSTPVFAKRYQAGRGTKDLYINFSALPGFNEYKLEITKSRADLSVKIHDVEFHTGKCQDFKIGEENGKPIYADENPVFFFDVADMLDKANMKPIYQPIIGKSFDGIAKEYLPIADIPVNGSTIIGGLEVNKVAVTNISSTMVTTWDNDTATIAEAKLFNLALTNKSGEDVDHKSNNAYLYVPANVSYTVDKVKGINISANGRAEMPEYLNGTRSDFPDRGVIAIKVQGTVDFFLLASSKYEDSSNRRTLKVYYTNDQMSNELKELKEWWFYGTRNEENNGSLPPLSVNVRLPQLGQDGTCTLFITYEGNGKGQSFTHADSDNDEIWIKGFVIKRPDLKVTIGRTDSKYVDKRYGPADDENKQENNTKLTHFGENKPYIWNFENVGFNNTKKDNLEEKKFNMMDGRTYVCGNNTNENGDLTDMDHLLLYNNASSAKELDKIQFDGRVAGQEHIEFCKASEYSISEKPGAERKNFDPIQSNGLKVNVTGSGWFKIKCSAPNGPVKVKVYSSTNYGASYINLLREFEVNTKGMSNAETNWQECTVFLKGHVNRTGNAGFWDGDYANTYDEGAEEIIRMSLFVVFDEMTGTTYDEGHPQFNIHELSWLNETPADYVFQREEDPKLLTTWQNIKRVYEQPDGTKKEETLLWWKAANDDDLKETIDGKKVDTYDVIGQFTRSISDGKGVKSPGSYASTSVPSDAGAYNAYWDIAAPAKTNAHTEAAYANGGHAFDGDHEYINKSNRQNTEFDMPVSGSFVRICAMKNTYVVAHVLPGAENAAVYVLDETGAQIPFAAGTDDAKRFGYIATMINANNDLSGGKASINGAIRVDFAANAGKEYFICAKGASISLARLEVHDWRYKPTKSSNVLALVDGANNSETITEAYNTKDFYRDATLTRTFKKDTWASLVLPFSLNEKKFEEVFGEGAQCLHFTDVDTKKNVTTLTHHYYNMIVAGRPVFIRPTNEVTDPSFADITLQAATIRNTTTTGFDFVASYDNATIVKNDLYLNNSNAIQYYAKASSSYPGMRSFIKNNCNYDFSSGTSEHSSPAKTMFLNFYDVDSSYATGIEELITGELSENTIVVTKSTKVYDLNGRAVAEGANISNLPAGIYIVNGKKLVVR